MITVTLENSVGCELKTITVDTSDANEAVMELVYNSILDVGDVITISRDY